jgi:hypothetical protein
MSAAVGVVRNMGPDMLRKTPVQSMLIEHDEAVHSPPEQTRHASSLVPAVAAIPSARVTGQKPRLLVAIKLFLGDITIGA